MRALGKVQVSCLDSLVEKGGAWTPACGWVWTNYSETVRILDSLVRRGLATRHEVGRPRDTSVRFVVTDAGRAAVAHLTKAREDLARILRTCDVAGCGARATQYYPGLDGGRARRCNAHYGASWTTSCSCGYQRSGLTSSRAAEDDADDHVACLVRAGDSTTHRTSTHSARVRS